MPIVKEKKAKWFLGPIDLSFWDNPTDDLYEQDFRDSIKTMTEKQKERLRKKLLKADIAPEEFGL